MVHLVTADGKSIHTDLTDNIRNILSNEGIPWSDMFKKPLKVSNECYNKVNSLLTPKKA